MSLPKYENIDLTNEDILNKAKRKIYGKFKSKVNLLPENEEETLKATFTPSISSGDIDSDVNNIIDIINKTISYVISLKSFIVPYNAPITSERKEDIKLLEADFKKELEKLKSSGLSDDSKNKLDMLNNGIEIIKAGFELNGELDRTQAYLSDIVKELEEFKKLAEPLTIEIKELTTALDLEKSKKSTSPKTPKEIARIKNKPSYKKIIEKVIYGKNKLKPFLEMEAEMERLKSIPGSEVELATLEKAYTDKIEKTFKGMMSGLATLKNETIATENKANNMLFNKGGNEEEIKRLTELLINKTDQFNKINNEIIDNEKLIKQTIETINKINDNLEKLEIDKTSVVLNKIFKTTNIDELEKIKQTILKNLGDIGRLTDKFYQNKNELLRDILIDSSILTIKKTKVDTESILDFDKLIQKIIFNFDEINKDLSELIPLISSINKSTFDKLIASAKSLKIKMDNLYFVIFNIDGSEKITSLKTATKMRFKDILENIKSIFDKMDILEKIIIKLYNVYNPIRTQLETSKGGRRNNGYVFNDLINHLPNRFH